MSTIFTSSCTSSVALSIGVAMMANKKALFLTLMDYIPQFEYIEVSFRQIQLIRCGYELLRCLGQYNNN